METVAVASLTVGMRCLVPRHLKDSRCSRATKLPPIRQARAKLRAANARFAEGFFAILQRTSRASVPIRVGQK
jgi:hypothetical protein